MPEPQQATSAPAPNIFDTLAQHDTQLAQHDQMVTQAAQPNIFDQLAANNGQLGQAKQTGPQLVAQPKSEDFHPEDVVSDPFQKLGFKIAAPFARKVMDAADKLREIENFTPEGAAQHPVQAFMGHIANRLEGFLFGNEQHPEDAIGTGKYGMATNPITAALIPGAEGEPALAGAVRGGANLVKSGVAAGRELLAGGKAGEEAPGVVTQVLKGRGVAQEPAKAAIRGAAGAEEEAALLEGHETVLDKPLKDIATKERAAYAKQDEAAGFDVKETRKKLSDAEYKVKQPEIDDAARGRLEKVIAESKQNLAEAEKRMSEAGVDAKAADTLHRQRMAGAEFKKALVQHISSDGESVNVDGLLNVSKKLRFSKFGDRLEQFMGKEGAEAYMGKLQEAHDLGVHAVKMRWIAASLPVIGGTIGEGLRLVKGITSAASNP